MASEASESKLNLEAILKLHSAAKVLTCANRTYRPKTNEFSITLIFSSVDFPSFFSPPFRVITSISSVIFHRKISDTEDSRIFRRQDFLRRDSEATRQLSDELNRFLIVAGLEGLRKGSMGKP
jgi:hypothetical protein